MHQEFISLVTPLNILFSYLCLFSPFYRNVNGPNSKIIQKKLFFFNSLQFPADLFTYIEEILNENLFFCTLFLLFLIAMTHKNKNRQELSQFSKIVTISFFYRFQHTLFNRTHNFRKVTPNVEQRKRKKLIQEIEKRRK